MTKKTTAPIINKKPSIQQSGKQNSKQNNDTKMNTDKNQPAKTNNKTDNKTDVKIKTSLLTKLVLLITLAIASYALYLAWFNSQDKWQVESINQLQSNHNQTKQDISALNENLKQVEAQLNSSNTRALITELEGKLNTEVVNLKSKISEMVLQKPEIQVTSLAETQQETPTSINFEKQLDEIKEQQQQLIAQNQQLQSSLASAQKVKKTEQLKKTNQAETINSVAKLSNKQVQNWVFQINNQWLFENNKSSTLNNLNALQQTISVSNLSYKQSLLARIEQDKQTVTNFSSSITTTNNLTDLKKWLTDLELPDLKIEPKEKQAPHETNQQTVADKLQNKLGALFNIRKKESPNDLSNVESELEKRIIKQRMLLQADQLAWAIHSHALQVADYAKNDISSLIKRYAPEQLSAWRSTMANLPPAKQTTKMPLSISEVNYVNHH